MKKLILSLMLLSSITVLSASDQSGCSFYTRGHFLYLNDVFDLGDEGYGSTFELGFTFCSEDNLYQSISLESGYITSDFSLTGVDIDIIPVLVNIIISSDFGNAFIWEIGGGVGGYSIDTNAIDADDDFVVGGQFFGRLGYRFNNGFDVTAGVRYIVSDDFDGIRNLDLSTEAFDLSLRYSF